MFKINNILNTLNIIPVDSRIAKITGFLRRNMNIRIADGLIAATALITRSILLTRNAKDFNKIPNLKVEKV
jgi:predicted nucleic acid-binding protein